MNINKMNIINPIAIDISNIRNERQKINNELAMNRIKERIFNKDIIFITCI